MAVWAAVGVEGLVGVLGVTALALWPLLREGGQERIVSTYETNFFLAASVLNVGLASWTMFHQGLFWVEAAPSAERTLGMLLLVPLFLFVAATPIAHMLHVRGSRPPSPGEADELERVLRNVAARAGFERDVRIRVSDRAPAPSALASVTGRVTLLWPTWRLRPRDGREARAFEATVAHELAHIAHGEARWFPAAVLQLQATAFWWVAFFAAVLYVGTQGRLDAQRDLLADALPGLLVLACTLPFLRRAFRIRELQADAAAARLVGPVAVMEAVTYWERAALGRAPAMRPSRLAGSFRGLATARPGIVGAFYRHHPTRRERMDALRTGRYEVLHPKPPDLGQAIWAGVAFPLTLFNVFTVLLVAAPLGEMRDETFRVVNAASLLFPLTVLLHGFGTPLLRGDPRLAPPGWLGRAAVPYAVAIGAAAAVVGGLERVAQALGGYVKLMLPDVATFVAIDLLLVPLTIVLLSRRRALATVRIEELGRDPYAGILMAIGAATVAVGGLALLVLQGPLIAAAAATGEPAESVRPFLIVGGMLVAAMMAGVLVGARLGDWIHGTGEGDSYHIRHPWGSLVVAWGWGSRGGKRTVGAVLAMHVLLVVGVPMVATIAILGALRLDEGIALVVVVLYFASARSAARWNFPFDWPRLVDYLALSDYLAAPPPERAVARLRGEVATLVRPDGSYVTRPHHRVHGALDATTIVGYVASKVGQPVREATIAHVRSCRRDDGGYAHSASAASSYMSTTYHATRFLVAAGQPLAGAEADATADFTLTALRETRGVAAPRERWRVGQVAARTLQALGRGPRLREGLTADDAMADWRRSTKALEPTFATVEMLEAMGDVDEMRRQELSASARGLVAKALRKGNSLDLADAHDVLRLVDRLALGGERDRLRESALKLLARASDQLAGDPPRART